MSETMRSAESRDAQAPPTRGPLHEALEAFVGEWQAEGWSYGNLPQDPEHPKAKRQAWRSTSHVGWHTGRFFLIEDERCMLDGQAPFDTHSVRGVDAGGRLFAACFENHGFERRYELTVQGRVWTWTGAHERARVEFSVDGHRQTVVWEWKPKDRWLPLCDREAVKVV